VKPSQHLNDHHRNPPPPIRTHQPLKQPTILNPIITDSNQPKTAEKEIEKREKNQIQIEEGRDRESKEQNREERKKKSNIE